MHNNYYFFRQLTPILGHTLKDCVISECFSQNKEELIIRFETRTTPFFIKASLLASFSCLSFPDNFQRARKNSVDLFEDLIGQRVNSIRQFENERSFALMLNNQYAMLFKMHGNRSNVILLKEGKSFALFRNNLPEDEGLVLDELDRKIDWSRECFDLNRDKLQTHYFTFGKLVWKYLDDAGFQKAVPDQQWQAVQAFRSDLEQPTYFIIELNDKLYLSLMRMGKVIKEFSDPVKAINEFFHTYTHHQALSKEKLTALSALKSKLHSGELYCKKTSNKLNELENNNNYKIWADLIMANLHVIKSGEEKVMLQDFYQENHLIEIKIKRDLSPQKNAEVFYRKSKNQQQELDRLNQSIETKQKEIEKIKEQIQKLENTEDLKGIRNLSTLFGLNASVEKQATPLPYHEFEFQGFKIWVGRNAQSNDTLTLKHSYKEDLWLHAKDVAGSHVLIKHRSGKEFPKEVIERAAQLAAYNSKRKTESLCPVSVTQKKFVRKRKGDPAGTVVVEREEVIMVEPKLVIGDQ
ncbi:MAG TPA: NFACT RNA binding domain-containing protein [Chryseolinea sp.]|nr:NFACT RNA binding domain-containing protein [Chryseolinea sp.]HPM30371.1 NFACT RNA binding domain-containing protein [Chryseolinea sp.]